MKVLKLHAIARFDATTFVDTTLFSRIMRPLSPLRDDVYTMLCSFNRPARHKERCEKTNRVNKCLHFILRKKRAAGELFIYHPHLLSQTVTRPH